MFKVMVTIKRVASVACLLVVLINNTSSLNMTLRQAAEKSGIFVGTALNYFSLQQDAQYAAMAGSQYSLMTPENGCKWGATEPESNEFNFTQCDFDYMFAQSNNMAFRGHNLCWGTDNPSWLEHGNFSSADLKQILENHIDTVIGHYPNSCSAIYSWDVVNEAVSDQPSRALFKTNVWFPAVSNYVELAFQYANVSRFRHGNKATKLFYNDYGILENSGKMASKSDAVYNMLKTMISNNVPIEGIGFQAHLITDDAPLNVSAIYSNFLRFAALGLEIHVSEMDVACTNCTEFTSETAQQQANMYQAVLSACLAVDNCQNFESWGFTDRYTWKGTNEYPLPFDTNLQAKPAAYAIEQELLTKKRTRTLPFF